MLWLVSSPEIVTPQRVDAFPLRVFPSDCNDPHNVEVSPHHQGLSALQILTQRISLLYNQLRSALTALSLKCVPPPAHFLSSKGPHSQLIAFSEIILFLSLFSPTFQFPGANS